MLTPIDYVFGGIVLLLYIYYAWKTISQQSIRIKGKYLFLWLALLIILIAINFSFTNIFLRFTVSTLILTIANMVIYKNSIKQGLLLSTFSQLILLGGEFTYVFIFMVCSKSFSFPEMDTTYGKFLANVAVAFFATLILNIPFVKNTCRKLITKYDKINNIQMIIPISILMISVNILLALVYSRIDNLMLLTINTILILIYTFIIISALRDRNKFIEVKEENKDLVVHLNEYEEILVTQRRRNHESKTELVVVRDLFKKKEYKRGLECLDEIIGTKEQLDETFYEMCQKMPSGIQGVVYQKLLVADPSIKIYMEVSPEIKKKELEKQMHSDVFLDACKMIGVFIGNSLEEVNEIEDKDNKIISVQLYIEGKKDLVIQIGNSYRKGTDFSKLGEEGYTTKGGDHGQGLSLVKDLEEKHPEISHETIVSGKIIFQKLKIKGLKY